MGGWKGWKFLLPIATILSGNATWGQMVQENYAWAAVGAFLTLVNLLLTAIAWMPEKREGSGDEEETT